MRIFASVEHSGQTSNLNYLTDDVKMILSFHNQVLFVIYRMVNRGLWVKLASCEQNISRGY